MYIKYILVLFSFFVCFSSLYAESQRVVDKDTIKILVQKVKQAAPSQRRMLMNELKMKLRTMHKETRMQVMLDLRRSFNGSRREKEHPLMIESQMQHADMMSITQMKRMQERMQGLRGKQRPLTHRPPVGMPSVHTLPKSLPHISPKGM